MNKQEFKTYLENIYFRFDRWDFNLEWFFTTVIFDKNLDFFEKNSKSRTKIDFCQKWVILSKLREQIVFLWVKISKILYLDPSILKKIAFLSTFFTHLVRENRFFFTSKNFPKTIISPLNYKKNDDFVQFLIKILRFFI